VLCPKCKKDQSHRSHRRGLIEHGVAVVGYYPYHCRSCDLRFLRFRAAPIDETAVEHPGVEREIKATRATRTAKRKRREVLLYGAAIVLFLAFLYYLTRDRGGPTGEGLAEPVRSHTAGDSLAA